MNWGTGIALFFTAFAALVATMVTASMMQKDIFLVEKDYYKEEINYQQKIEKYRNASSLQAAPQVRVQAGTLQVQWPADGLPSQGEVWLFRPSNAGMDRRIALKPGSSHTSIATRQLAPGLWKMKMSWQAGGRHHYAEETVVLP